MLRELTVLKDKVDQSRYPFSVPAISTLEKMEFNHRVTFFIGENGTGKSTLLEAIAAKVGLNSEGGSKNFLHKTSESANNATVELADTLRLSWDKKYFEGYFFRAESFFTLASELERIQSETPNQDAFAAYGGFSLHNMSHGQSFFALFNNRLSRDGFYLFDEPEAALSPQKQLSFLVWLHEFTSKTSGQCIIATHSPLILAYPDAEIFSFDKGGVCLVKYEDTYHYNLTRDFLNNPKEYLKRLFLEALD